MSIYHLHIPRTSGVFVRESIIKKSKENNFVGHKLFLPDSFSQFKNISGHFATTPIPDVSFNFAIVRNPVEITFSYIMYMRDGFYPNLSFSELVQHYIYNNKIEHFTNINLKFLTGIIDKEKYNLNIYNLKNVAESGWHIYNYSSDVASAIKTVEKNNTRILFYSDSRKYEKVAKFYNVICDADPVNMSSKIDDLDKNKYSQIFFDLNQLDLEFYENLKKNF